MRKLRVVKSTKEAETTGLKKGGNCASTWVYTVKYIIGRVVRKRRKGLLHLLEPYVSVTWPVYTMAYLICKIAVCGLRDLTEGNHILGCFRPPCGVGDRLR